MITTSYGIASRSVILFILGRALPRTGNGLSFDPLSRIDRAVKNPPYKDMGYQPQDFEIDMATSVLGWWQDAGVDCSISETPHGWLRPAGSTKSSTTADTVEAKRAAPQTLDALISYLMTGEIADAGPANRRVRPSGDPASPLMILTDCPDAADIESGELICDPVFTKMLEAIGKRRADVYIASLCPGRPVTGRISDDSLSTLAILAKQHIALVCPKQLWLVGTAASRAILGIDDAAAKGKLHSVNHLGTIMNVIATAHPRMFEGSKSRKSAAWAEMQRLISREDV